jgi:hypothetical protein
VSGSVVGESALTAPTPQMLALADKLAGFIAGGGWHLPRDLFASEDVVIIENFAPFVFRDVSHWATMMRLHLEDLSDLTHSFGTPIDFLQEGDSAYFSLPTIWSGLDRGVPFRESGGWALVIARTPQGWRLKAYGWAVTQTSTSP